MELEMAGWPLSSNLAAAEKEPSSTTATNACSWLTLHLISNILIFVSENY